MSTGGVLPGPLLQNTGLCISQPPRPQPRRWAPPCRTQVQPLSSSGPQTCHWPNRDSAAFSGRRKERSGGGQGPDPERVCLCASSTHPAPLRSARPRSRRASGPGGAPRATLAFCYLPGAGPTSATCRPGGLGGAGGAGPSPSAPPPGPGASRGSFVRSTPAPLAGFVLPVPSATRVDCSPTVAESRLHFPAGVQATCLSAPIA